MEGVEYDYSLDTYYRKSYLSRTLSDQKIRLIREMLTSSTPTKDMSYEPISKPEDNSATEIYAVQITERFGHLHKYIAKMRKTNNPTLDEMTDFNNIIFRNEITVFTKVFLEYYVIRHVYRCHSQELFSTTDFLDILDEETSKMMILTDFKEYGCVNLDQLRPLSNNTVRVVLRHLARFHTLSYTLKEKSPEFFSELSNSLNDTNIFKLMSLQKSHKNGFSLLGHYFSEMFDNVKIKNLIMESFTKYADRVNSSENYENNSNHSIIIHGDCWVKNILFSMKGDITTSCIFIDYQLSRVASPAVDVLHFIFNSTDYKTRSKHYHDWLDFYYSQLQKNLWKYDVDQSIYPRSEFHAEIKKYFEFQLGTAIIRLCFLLRGTKESKFLKYAMSDSEDVQDLMNSLKSNVVTEDTIKNITDRIEGLINSCQEFGY